MKDVLQIFLLIFLAELGDKTQLATITFATKYGWLKAFIGAVSALAVVNLIGALIGEKIGDYFTMSVINKAAGILFIIFGILIFFDKI
ncbi:TMEM165/GDT1 family protein [Pyrococcus horikoshii]|uniref:TMEM165/GDT1 family protein n=1 Tax=Pyrococcus horikoshii TaxID=53953 RepID=A0A832T041_PYRHR|nr:TMEM165/GDT1 family protein [Pyrococcus horikoshii]HII61419.1 TMEM165/GDT1 family protein [Pyrococcus horikoshii]